MKKAWWPWILLIAVFSSAQFWGSGWKRGADGTMIPAAETSGATGIVLPDCPSDITQLRFGTFCKHVSLGIVCTRDAQGTFNLRGGGPCSGLE